MRCRIVLLIMLGLLHLESAAAQDPPCDAGSPRVCNHDGYYLWDALKMLPVRFTDFTSDSVRWKYEDEHTVKLGEFILNGNAKYISREKKVVNVQYLMQHKESDWLCYYCSQCNKLLRAYELKPGSLRS